MEHPSSFCDLHWNTMKTEHCVAHKKKHQPHTTTTTTTTHLSLQLHTSHPHHSSSSPSLTFLPSLKIALTSTLLLLLLFLGSASAQNCTNSAGCYPPIGNLALGRIIQVNSTCSENDLFCPLFLNTDCEICSPTNTHSAASLNDNNNSTFWVSEIGPNVQKVGFRLDFEAPVLFQDMTLVWQSVRPIAMTLERSCDDGETWLPYRYYALNCAASFMMNDTFVGDGIPPFNGTTPVCTSTQTELFSFGFTDAVMTFSTSQHIPLNNEEAACYQTITNIRVVVCDLFPEVRISNSSFMYFGVREWIVRGACMCNGHADTCVPRPGEDIVVNKVYTGCVCQHNTAPPDCGTCLTGFNNAPYRQGTTEEANVCEACMCNEHAVDCEFNEGLSTSVCINCSDNTTGNQCGQCRIGFYQDAQLLLNDPNICTACECNPDGITDSGACNSAGQCNCKPNVESLQCSQCQDGYFNLSSSDPNGCQLCDCNQFGSLLNEQGLPRCNRTTGECFCRDTAEGTRCNLCQPGSYDLGSGCRRCDCNIGGSVSQLCNQDPPVGQCPCKPNITGTLCSIPQPGYYFMILDSFIFEAEDTPFPSEAGLIQPLNFGQYGTFTGRGFISVPAEISTMFIFSPPQDSQYEIIVRLSSAMTSPVSASFLLSSLDPVSTSLNCSTGSPPTNDTLSYTRQLSSVQYSQGYYMIDSVCLMRSTQYLLLISHSSSSIQLLLDSVVLFPDVTVTSAYYASITGQPMQQLVDSCLPRSAATNAVGRIECEDLTFTLSTEFQGDNPLQACDCDPVGTLDINRTCTAFGGGCGPCKPGVTGRRCDTCLNGFFGFSSSGCQACQCDSVGSPSPICMDSGQCACRPGVDGRTCNACLPNFFNFTSNGCSVCNCSEFSSSLSCNITSGECLCPRRVTGRTCNACAPESFNLTVEGCQACNCSAVGSVNAECDGVTGQCECTRNLTGLRCDECSSGFFNTGGTSREICARCICSGRSTTCSLAAQESQLQAVHFNLSQLCSADPTSCSNGWRIVTSGGHDASLFGPNDINGLGYILTVNMRPMVVVPDEFLGNRLGAYGLNFTASIAVVNNATIKRNIILIRLNSSRSNTNLVGFPYIETASNGLQGATFLSLTISFVETNWNYENSTGGNPSLLDFLSFLTNITEISFTADFTGDFIEFNYLRVVTLTYLSSPSDVTLPPSITNSSISLPSTYPVEDCSCPAPYRGLSCQSCARGYFRPSGLVMDPCLQCNCNGQTLDCDLVTGTCLNCSGNTTGSNCERCIDGFYGDPTRGIPCMPCNCPLAGNSFSPTCSLNLTDSQSTCDNCAPGYTGRNCEICMDGFFGNPMIGRCTTCECNGNIDPALGPTCDMSTGQCMNCQNNTVGFECEICQNGFFGDPGTGIPCQPCPCDARGTVTYCDPLFGTCNCLPNVMGARCDSCRPGFFNITTGVGCIECTCDTVGAENSICNQESGDCSCLPNVGSPTDNNCRMCTPGYFNLTAGVGCQACGCSNLSMSDSCHAETGACECQVGAVGLKCDDCAFGFTGQVPDCERCHDCYSQWVYIIGNFSSRVRDLESNTSLLLTTFYNGHTLESLNAQISSLVNQLTRINGTLDSITLEQSNVTELERTLNSINTSFIGLNQQVVTIQSDLDKAQRILDIASQFDGTVNMTDVMELGRRLRSVNTTLTQITLQANQSFAQFLVDQDTINTNWSAIETLNVTAMGILMNFTQVADTLEPIRVIINDINSTYMQLRENLTRLDMQANALTGRFVRLTERVSSASSNIRSASGNLSSLSSEVQMRQNAVDNLLSLVQALNVSIQTLEMVVQEAETGARTLMDAVRLAIPEANSTLQNITATLSDIMAISANLTRALNISRSLQSIQLPSLQSAQLLAARIINNIVPDEQVVEIMRNVTESRRIVDQALSLAQNASAAVMSARTLVDAIQNDIACVNVTQNQVEETLFMVMQMINQAQSDVAQVASISSQLEMVTLAVNATANSTMEIIREASALGVSARTRASDLLNQAEGNASEARQYRQDIEQAQRDLDELGRSANGAATNASIAFTDALDLNNDAQALGANATRISIMDINNLLLEYQRELNLTRALEQEMIMLIEEMETLTDTFTAASQRLQRCYRTP